MMPNYENPFVTVRRLSKYPPIFRPPHGKMRKGIKGGRWQVRKVREPYFPWFAWTTGLSKKYRFRFQTHAQAVSWAQKVASTYAESRGNPGSPAMEELNDLFKRMREMRKDQLRAIRNPRKHIDHWRLDSEAAEAVALPHDEHNRH